MKVGMMKILPVVSIVNIGAHSCELLREVVCQDQDGREVGLSYLDVLGLVRERYPECKTSVRSLQWYNSDMKGKGKSLPVRPRFSTREYREE